MEQHQGLRKEPRWPSWISLALGFAGVLVTIAGILEWNRNRPDSEQMKAQPAEQSPVPRVDNAERLQRVALIEAERRSQLAEIERRREAAMQRSTGPREPQRFRCINGDLIEKRGREWIQHGKC
ncbi:hypothetical protein [Lysobacter sp. D1-1-M9]|uniref:hypothetical protein n=1 Tax=Novilysobacter longmucuonensis TaxID=3098603 RepID=UPI002FC59205